MEKELAERILSCSEKSLEAWREEQKERAGRIKQSAKLWVLTGKDIAAAAIKYQTNALHLAHPGCGPVVTGSWVLLPTPTSTVTGSWSQLMPKCVPYCLLTFSLGTMGS